MAKKYCPALLWHGPGHQSSTHCRLTDKHYIHECIYGEFSQLAQWRGKKKLTGFFDEPPVLRLKKTRR